MEFSFTESHRPEEAIPDSYDKWELGLTIYKVIKYLEEYVQ